MWLLMGSSEVFRSTVPVRLTKFYEPGPRPPTGGVVPALNGEGSGVCVSTYMRVAASREELLRVRGGGGLRQPWRCLWRRFSQMTMTRP
jgi:hypothetical protein